MNENLKIKYEKDNKEAEVCMEFLFAYNEENNTSLNFIRHGNQVEKEPDCICSNNIAIELVGVHDNEYLTEKLESFIKDKPIRKNPDYLLRSLENLPCQIVKKLNKLNNGYYNGTNGKIILLCHFESRLIDDNDINNYYHDSFRDDVQFKKYFDEIWIQWKPNGANYYKIKKLE